MEEQTQRAVITYVACTISLFGLGGVAWYLVPWLLDGVHHFGWLTGMHFGNSDALEAAMMSGGWLDVGRYITEFGSRLVWLLLGFACIAIPVAWVRDRWL